MGVQVMGVEKQESYAEKIIIKKSTWENFQFVIWVDLQYPIINAVL